jgi:hypothetical protein
LYQFQRDIVTRFFASGFFQIYLPPKPLKITLGSFQISLKIRGDICKSRFITGFNATGGKFAPGVNYTGKFASSTADVVDTGGKLPPVSTLLAVINTSVNLPSFCLLLNGG